MLSRFAIINFVSKIAVFYHIYQCDNWGKLFWEQYSLLMSSGLGWQADLVHIGVNGDQELMMFPSDEKNTVPLPSFEIKQNQNPQLEETDTLLSLSKFAEENKDYKILYMHMKGVTKQDNLEVRDWRNMMEYFCIERWEDCVALLDEHDAVGCNFQDNCYWGFYPHFSGNFWWANAKHIQQLDKSYLESNFRHHREFWIGSKPNADLYEIHNSGVANHFYERYPKERYRNEQSV